MREVKHAPLTEIDRRTIERRVAERRNASLARPVSKITTYAVTLDTPKGQAQLDVPSSLGPEAAARRAIVTASSIGWGDLPDIRVLSAIPTGGYFPALAYAPDSPAGLREIPHNTTVALGEWK